MNVNVLIDAIVRQTMVLIAHLATAAGARTPLTHVANQIFLDLVRQLQSQGLRQKIIADMFGLALRTYHEKVRRLTESTTDRGRTLWEAMLSFVQEKGTVTRTELLARFARDEDLMVRSVISDLVESGLVFRSGRGDRTVYRAMDPASESVDDSGDDIEMLVWVMIQRGGPIAKQQLYDALSGNQAAIDASLDRLVADGRVDQRAVDGVAVYSSEVCVIPYETPAGWEAAVFDHFQAVVTSIVAKVQSGANQARRDDRVGGSTYSFDIWPGHPDEEDVVGLLSFVRDRASELRARVDRYNQTASPPRDAAQRVTFYAGQRLSASDTDEGNS